MQQHLSTEQLTELRGETQEGFWPHQPFSRSETVWESSSHIHKEGIASRRLSTSWVQPLPQVTQNFTSRTTYTFASSEPKTCLETSGLGKKKKKILETYTEKVSVGRFFFFLGSGRGEKRGEEGDFHVKYSVSE